MHLYGTTPTPSSNPPPKHPIEGPKWQRRQLTSGANHTTPYVEDEEEADKQKAFYQEDHIQCKECPEEFDSNNAIFTHLRSTHPSPAL
jgi:hypothetical protein